MVRPYAGEAVRVDVVRSARQIPEHNLKQGQPTGHLALPDCCEPSRLPSGCPCRAKLLGCGIGTAHIRKGGTRTHPGPQRERQHRRNDCLFLHQSMLTIFPGGAHFGYVLGGHKNVRFMKERVAIFRLPFRMKEKSSFNPGGPGGPKD